MWQWTITVLCLTLVTGGESCCQPDKFGGEYTVNVDGNVPMGAPGGKSAKISARIIGSGQIDWETQNGLEQLQGSVTMPINDEGLTMDVHVKGKVGILTDDTGTKIWVKAQVPMMRISKCKYFQVIGGIPKNYQCLMNYYKKQGDKTYTSMFPNPMVQELYKVDDNCIPAKESVKINVPSMNMKLELTAEVTKVELSVVDIDNGLPEGCEMAGATQLPPPEGGQAGMSALVGMAMQSKAGNGQGMKRSLHHAVLEDVVKRSIEEISKRAEQKRYTRMLRNVRAAYNHVFK